MRLKVLKEVYYAGKTRHVDDEFDCDEADVCRIWTAKDVPGGPTVEVVENPKPFIDPRTLKVLKTHVPEEEKLPEPESRPVEPVVEQDLTGRKRFYRRRDMKAE
jgi:hypothetical protein